MKQPLATSAQILASFDILGKDEHVGFHGITVTQEELQAAYPNAKWYLIYNPPFGNVLNMVCEMEGKGILWESFANVDGDERHWLHFEQEEWENPRLWSQDKPSFDKPDEVIGIQWYAYRVPEPNPYLCQLHKSKEGA